MITDGQRVDMTRWLSQRVTTLLAANRVGLDPPPPSLPPPHVALSLGILEELEHAAQVIMTALSDHRKYSFAA